MSDQVYGEYPLDDGIRLFYDLWESKMHKIHLPEIIGKVCHASYRGWLLLVAPGGAELFLLNPLTRARVQLPPLTTPVKRIWDEGWNKGNIPYDDIHFLLKTIIGNYHLISKMTFSTNLTDPNCLITVLFQGSQRILFCKVGDHCWTQLVGPHSVLDDAAYRNGRFYLLNNVALYIYDLNQHKAQGTYFFKPELQSLSKFFLVGKSELYMVVVHRTEDKGVQEALTKAPKQKIELYQVQEQQWMEVKRIADTSDITIFNGDNEHYLAVCADDWDSLDGDCMYKEYVCSSSVHNYWDELCHSIYFAKPIDGNPEPVMLDIAKKPWSPKPAMWFQPSFI